MRGDFIMILDEIIFKLTVIGIGITIIKVGVFYCIAKINQQKYKVKAKNNGNNTIQTTALPKGYLKYYYFNSNTNQSKTPTNSISKIEKPIPRDTKVEERYKEVKAIFNSKMKNKKMNRDEILALREYLSKNVFKYEQKKYKNDAHAIYSMLKAKDLTLEHLDEIEKFLNSVD